MTLSDLAEVFARELGPDTAHRAMALLCRHAAGDRIYIPHQPRPEIHSADTVATLQARYAISRRTAYYWLNARRDARAHPCAAHPETAHP